MTEPVQLSLLDQQVEDDLSFGEWVESLPPMSAEPESKFGAGAKVSELEEAA